MSKKKFRTGQRVQLASDPAQTFVIDRSMVPERIYYAANRWWTKDELQRLGDPENPATSIRLNGKAGCAQDARKCAQVVSGRPTIKDSSSALAWRECLECRTVFEPTRDWKRFCSTSCRRSYWRQARKRTKAVDVLTPGTAVA